MLVAVGVAVLAAGLVWWVVATRTPTPWQAVATDVATAVPAPSATAPSPAAPSAAAPSAAVPSAAPSGRQAASDQAPAASAKPAAPGTTASAGPAATGPAATAPTATGPAPAGEAAVQARAVNALLAGSNAAHAGLTDAISDATRCRRAGLNTIQRITAARRDQLAAARALRADALPGGAALKRSLVAALDASFDADAAFLTWARRHVAAGCADPVAGDRDYRRGLARSQDARKAKTRFATAWRPIAETHGLTAWRPDQI
ncbi:hypothetical protein MF672_040800 [Actinomadura sp. ATCC 31491]|uniref:DUF4439 domain-containing protein n=1 Tax=Actinomadura luzonensis TaxID=2805427 RepID=A0ABT0G7K2_9ACTN|nr:hypothetical protein [Actinomadura luzonensis]MCK2220093.1 hypothetical protein [Actinomadura luzonensis]